MNKKRYKLIFSKVKCCLIPVGENIKSAIGNTTSLSSNKEIGENQEDLTACKRSLLSSCIELELNPIRVLNSFQWKNISFVLLTTIFSPALANDAIVNGSNTHIEQKENKVLIVDVAPPDKEGISDNRFSKLNIPNGAVFNNSLKPGESELVGYLDKNRSFDKESAKAILNQVTGAEMSKIQGGLEVFGDKADLIIVNPNGITINGVKTFNTDRFTVSTSDVVNKDKHLLSTTRGKVIIEEKGIATDGLSYFDVIAKTIEQKGPINSEKKHPDKKLVNINFVAGSSDFDLKNRQITSKGETSPTSEIAISGNFAGAMYGDQIQLVTTDTGAGVNHQGTILSEKNIKIATQNGNINVKELYSPKVDLEGKDIELADKGNIRVSELVTFNATNKVALGKTTKVSAPKAEFKTNKVTVDNNATVVAKNLSIESKAEIENNGTLIARNNNLITKKLVNNKDGAILVEENLTISVQGNKNELLNGYINKGVIKSNKNASLTFERSDFISHHDPLPQAKESLIINANNVSIAKGDEFQQQAKVTVNAKGQFVNNGVLTSAKELEIHSKEDNIINNGLLGSKKALNLVSKSGFIVNNINGIFHSDGTSTFDAKNNLINLGEIYSKGHAKVDALTLENKASIGGGLKKVFHQRSNTDYAYYRARYDEFTISGLFPEIESSIKAEKVGRIIADNGLTFIAKDKINSAIVNNGIINVKGDLKYDFNKFINNMGSANMNLYKDIFLSKMDLNVSFQPKLPILTTPLDSAAVYKFDTLAKLMEHIFDDSKSFATTLYTADKIDVLNTLKNIKSPILQKSLSAVFGAGWDSKVLPEFRTNNETHFNQLKERWKKFKESELKIHFYPSEKAKVFADRIISKNNIQGSFQNGAYAERGDSSKPTNTFKVGRHEILVPEANFESYTNKIKENGDKIDLSTLLELLAQPQLFIDSEKPKEKDFTLNNEDDKKLLEETEQEKQQKEIERKKQEQERLKREQAEKDAANQRLKELAEEQARLRDEIRKQKEKDQLDIQKEKLRLEKEQKEREKQLREEELKLKELKKYKLLEKKRIQEEKALAEKIQRLKKEQERQALMRELEVQKLELQRKQEAEKKRQELERLENEEKAQREKLQKLEARKAEQLRRLEYEKMLADARRKADELAKQRSIPEKKDLPNVETDPLYRTRVRYINQDDYIGSKYFFNKIAPRTENKKTIKVIGDNYFEHQLITRSIEKKVDNQLYLKYNLTNINLVKKLMDNAYSASQNMKLTLGEALTKEQKENLKEDIIWYVKTEINGKEVFIPQVYFAKQTIKDAEKSRGVGNAILHARSEIDVKAKDIHNSGVIAGSKVNLSADFKLKNRGDILSKEESNLQGKKGIESSGTTYIDENGNTKVRKSQIKSEGHLHLGTDQDSSVNFTASNIKGKTGQIKSKDLNLNDTYETNRSHEYKESSRGYVEKNTSEVKSIGTKAEFDHLHLSLSGNANQKGSELKTNRITGVVKGEFNAQAGKNISNREIYSSTWGLEASASASGGGTSVGTMISEQGRESYVGKASTTSATASVGLAKTSKTDRENELIHKNSQLTAKSGELYVLKKADIGGADINKDLEVPSESKENIRTPEISSNAMDEKAKTSPKFKTLSEAEIAEQLKTKDRSFFAKHKANESEDQKKGFTLSAQKVASTKVKDEKEVYSSKTKFSLGIETEAHSAIADAVSNTARQVRDAGQGIKQDSTAVLQQLSDAANLVTGDLAGGSIKQKFEFSNEVKTLTRTADNRNIIGGRTNLHAREGDVDLKNVETTQNSQVAIKARDSVNIEAGVTKTSEKSKLASLKVAQGVSVGCGVLAQGCTVGASSSISGNNTDSEAQSTTYQNSVLKSRNLNIEAGKDFNLLSSNIDAKKLHLDVKGKTNIESKQDTSSRIEKGINYSAGLGVSTSLSVKPNGSVGLGMSFENESRKMVNRQAGISAQEITGKINDLALNAGYIESQGNSDKLKVQGQVTSKTLKDSHHKDGGNFGGAFGVSETGIGQFNVNGGRVEQRHYEATQHSTLSKVKTNTPIQGDIKQDRLQAKEITRNDTYASTQFNFEVMDIVETGKRVKDKVKNKLGSSSEVETSSASSTPNRLNSDGDNLPSNVARRPSVDSNEGDYAEISPLLARNAKTSNAESDYEDVSNFANNASNVKPGKSADSAEPIYAKVDKSAEARANAKGDEAAKKLGDPRVKPQVQEEEAPALPPRTLLKDSVDNHSVTSSQEAQSYSTSLPKPDKVPFLQKVKQFFTGHGKTTKEKNIEQTNQEKILAKPNYDNLDDNLNLKGLLALENKRNDDFDANVLKNTKFLDEAKEAAKKSVPESVIKQMGNSPEFDAILTEGAKKTEKRINDAVTFKPKAEEFSEIQRLVKQLPKGEPVADILEKTNRITDALAETSKTIQRNPKLKEEIGEAIGEFLKKSQNQDLTVDMIEKLNYGLRPDEGNERLLYKKESLTKENAVFSSPEAAKIQLAETVNFINKAKAEGVEPSVLAGLVYQRLIAYHPFAEGNGRMARVVVNKLLLDAGYPAFTKFSEQFETQIIPQTEARAKSATGSEVVTEFLKELGQKTLPQLSSKPKISQDVMEGDYVDFLAIKNNVNGHKESDYAEIPSITSKAVSNNTEEMVEPIYGKIDKSPESIARANAKGDEAAKKQGDPRVKPQVQEEDAPELPPRNLSHISPSQNATPISDRIKRRELVEKPRSLLDQVKDTFQPVKVGSRINDVRNSAKEFNGEVSFPFAQSKGKVYKEIVKHAETQNGVCESTCAHWIAKKVQKDQSLWDDLYDGGKDGKLNKETIDSIKKLQTEFISAGSATQQFKLTEEWLSEKGVIAKQKKVGDFSRKDEVSGTVSSKNVDALVKAILDTGTQRSAIKKISINLKGGSHTVSAAIEGEKVVFFDPNFGEMTFPSRAKFANWMEKAFWQKSGYAGTDNNKRFFNVVNYELAQ